MTLQINSRVSERIEDMLVPVEVAYAWGNMQSYNRPIWFGKDFFWIPDENVCFSDFFYNSIVGWKLHILWIIKVKVSVICSALGYPNMQELFNYLWIRDISSELSWTCDIFRRKLLMAISYKWQEKRKIIDPYFYFDENKEYYKATKEQYFELFDKYVKDNDLVGKLVPSEHKIPRWGCSVF